MTSSEQRRRSRASGAQERRRSGIFVGRTNELAALASALPRNRPDGAELWMVAGEAGIGKTRLVQELAYVATQTGHRVAWGQCWDEAGTPPYWPWVQVVRQLRGEYTGVDLASFVLPDAGPTDRFTLFDATAAELRQATAASPLLLVLDDLHRSDPSSLMLTRFLVAHLSDTPLLIVATYRPDESAVRADIAGYVGALAETATTIALTGLAPDEVDQLLTGDLAAVDVHAATGGNPLFVEQIIRLAAGDVPHDPGPPTARPGHTALLAALRTRLAGLDAAAMDVLAGIAVLGPATTPSTLAALLHADATTLDRLTSRIADAGLLSSDRRSLSHPLMAEAVIELVPDKRLEELHFIAAGLDGAEGSSAAERAHHLRRAGDHHWHAAVAACCEAAAFASESLAHTDAVAHLERALRLVEEHDATTQLAFDVTFALAGALERAGRRVDAERTYERASGHAHDSGDIELVARAAARHGISFYADAHQHRGRAAECNVAIEICPTGDSALRVRLLATLAASQITGRTSARVADEAVAMGRRVGDAAALATALVAQQVTDLGPSTLQRRLHTSREIVALAEQCGDSELAIRGRFLLKNALLEAGDVRELDTELRAQDQFITETADARFARHSLWFRCMRASLDGHANQVAALASRCLEISNELQDPDGFGVYAGQYGVALWMQGRLVELEPLYLDLMHAEPDSPLWPSVLGWIWLHDGRHEAARGMLDRMPPPGRLPSDMHSLLNLYTLADLAVAVGDDELVEATWETLLPFADRVVPIAMGAACFGVVARPLGQLAIRLGRHDEGLAHLERAIEITARMAARPWLIDAQLALAEALLDMGHPDDGRLPDLVHEASATATGLDLGVFADRIAGLTGRVDAMSRAAPVAAAGACADGRPGRARVSVLGAFEVRAIDGSSPRWTSRKARSLLKILVARRGSPVAREQLMDMLWPGADPAGLANRMSVAVSTVRRALDPARSLPIDALIRGEGGTLRLMIEAVDVDVESFQHSGAAALDAQRTGHPDAHSMLRAALAEYRGEALPDEPYEPWADALRSTVSATYAALLRATAELATASGDRLLVADAMRQLVALDPYDESAHIGLVEALRCLGAHGQARIAYDDYVERMADLGIEVGPGGGAP